MNKVVTGGGNDVPSQGCWAYSSWYGEELDNPWNSGIAPLNKVDPVWTLMGADQEHPTVETAGQRPQDLLISNSWPGKVWRSTRKICNLWFG